MLAAEYPVAGLILVTPFLSVREVLRNSVGALADLTEDCFRNYKLADQIEIPTLIIHGTQDSLVPISHGLELYEQIAGEKMMVCPDKWHHNSSLLDNVNMFVTPMTQFFSLPDYTFTEVEVPSWVLPANLNCTEAINKGQTKGFLDDTIRPQLRTPRTTKGPCGWTPRPVKIHPVNANKDPMPVPA